MKVLCILYAEYAEFMKYVSKLDRCYFFTSGKKIRKKNKKTFQV